MKTGKKLCRLAALLISAAVMMCSPAASAENAEGGRYVSTVYTDKNGLPTSEANVVTQTSDGYIWIGSYGGLVRYDGTTFRNYSLENKIGTSAIRSLFEDSKGRLWIGTNDVGLYMYHKDVFTKITNDDPYSFLCIRDFAESSDGTIYAASSSGLAKIIEGEVVPVEQEGFSGETVYSIAADTHDRVWCAMASGRCVIIGTDGKILRELYHEDLSLGSDIYSVENGKGGEIYIGTLQSVVAKLSFPSDSTEPNSFISTKYNTGGIYTHNHIKLASNGDILVSGINGFCVIDSSGSITEFDENDNAASVNCSVRDYEGCYWLATSVNGVVKLNMGCFGSPNEAAGLDGVSINAIAKQNGLYYIGIDTGLMIFDSEWNRIENDLTATLDGVRVRGITTDNNGNVWLMVYSDYAVMRYNPATGSTATFGESNGFISNRGRCAAVLSDGTVAVGTQHGVAIIDGDTIKASYGVEDGITNPYILSLLEGDDGTLYAGSDGAGIYVIKDGKVSNHYVENGLAEGVVLRMAKDTDGSGIFICAGNNLYYMENGTTRRLDSFEKGIGSIFDAVDHDGRLWVMQNKGLYSVDKKALLSGEKTDITLYSFNHGLTGSLQANTWSCIDENGTLYLPTGSGISSFDFKGTANTVPKALINSVTIDGEVMEHPQKLELKQSAGRVTIDFAALTYTGTSNFHIAYMLEGFDTEETILTDSQSFKVSYTNIPGGDYSFKIRLYDPESPDTTQEYVLPVNKAKKLHEELYFWILLAVIIAAVSVGVSLLVTKMRVERMRHRRDEYKNIVEQSLTTFAKTIDAKDTYTNGHSIRVAQYSREIARRMNFSEEEQERIYYVALLHDIGKIGIPDHILCKPGALTPEERKVIETHTTIGGGILKDFNALMGITEGAKYHHERFDGKGYCEGKKAEEIPLVARIIGVADSYDAMSSDRCYRKALSNEVILSELEKAKGTQLDPDIVPYMLEMMKDGFAPIER